MVRAAVLSLLIHVHRRAHRSDLPWSLEWGSRADFRHAHLRIDGQEVKGDIELHLSQEGWVHHRHHLDPRYDQVVLHVCLWSPQKELSIQTCNGRDIKQTFLEPFLTIPISRIARLLDLDLYPYRKFVGSGRCAQALFRHLPESSINTLFSSAAQWRFREKRNYLTEHVQNKELRLSTGMAAALGYKHHTQEFVNLYVWLKTQTVSSLEDQIALLLGVSGFFQEPYCSRWSQSLAYRDYASRWKAMDHEKFTHFPLKVHAARPYNHPVRRLVALAYISQDSSLPALFSQFVGTWKGCWEDCVKPSEYRRLSKTLLALFPAYQHPYWNRHFLFEEQPTDQFLTLMGQDLYLVLVNTLVPLLQESCSNPQEEQALLQFTHALTLPASGKRKYLVHRFFGDSPQGAGYYQRTHGARSV